jgi:hypothetical protein
MSASSLRIGTRSRKVTRLKQTCYLKRRDFSPFSNWRLRRTPAHKKIDCSVRRRILLARCPRTRSLVFGVCSWERPGCQECRKSSDRNQSPQGQQTMTTTGKDLLESTHFRSESPAFAAVWPVTFSLSLFLDAKLPYSKRFVTQRWRWPLARLFTIVTPWIGLLRQLSILAARHFSRSPCVAWAV